MNQIYVLHTTNIFYLLSIISRFLPMNDVLKSSSFRKIDGFENRLKFPNGLFHRKLCLRSTKCAFRNCYFISGCSMLNCSLDWKKCKQCKNLLGSSFHSGALSCHYGKIKKKPNPSDIKWLATNDVFFSLTCFIRTMNTHKMINCQFSLQPKLRATYN